MAGRAATRAVLSPLPGGEGPYRGTTGRQSGYLHDLGSDDRVDPDGGTRAQASEGIDELEGLVKRVGLLVGRPPKADLLYGAPGRVPAPPVTLPIPGIGPGGTGPLLRDGSVMSSTGSGSSKWVQGVLN